MDVPSPGQVHQNCPRYLRFRDYIQADLGQVMMMVVLETAHLSSYSSAYDTEADSSSGTLDGTRAGSNEMISKGFLTAPNRGLPACRLFSVVVETLDLTQGPWEGASSMALSVANRQPGAC